MAAVSYLHLREEDTDLDQSEDSVFLDSLPYWAHHDLNSFPVPGVPPPDRAPVTADPSNCERSIRFQGEDNISETDSTASVDLFDRENQVNFVMDLFQQRVEESRAIVEGDFNNSSSESVNDSSHGSLEGTGEICSDNFELDLGLGPRLGLGIVVDFSESEGENFDFYVQRRVSNSGSESAEWSSIVRGPEVFETGDRVSEFGSDEDESESSVLEIELQPELDGDDDMSVHLPWDSLHLEYHSNEDFEWEEVDGRAAEREIWNGAIDDDDDDDGDDESVSVLPVIGSEEEESRVIERVGGTLGNLEWQVLLTPDNLEGNSDHELEDEPQLGGGDHDDYIYTAELFGQFGDGENGPMAKPPASILAIQNLVSVAVTQEDVQKGNALCAVCKDEVRVGDEAKQLPCSHKYHGDCIVPWLGIRNTCPVCRYELPSDDPEYERRRIQRPVLRP